MYTFDYAEGWSYLSDPSGACNNCHVMREASDRWSHSGHKHVAACTDCHMPHDPLRKLLAEAANGWNHGWAFTLCDFDEPIRIKPFNARVVQENCVACHQDLLGVGRHSTLAEEPSCLSCHASVGHGGAAY